jgi:hypothetical protein
MAKSTDTVAPAMRYSSSLLRNPSRNEIRLGGFIPVKVGV